MTKGKRNCYGLASVRLPPRKTRKGLPAHQCRGEQMKQMWVAIALALTVLLLSDVQAQEARGNLTQGVPVIVTDPQECPEPKRYTLNQDIYSLDNMIIRYLIELMTSVSSEVQVIQQPDRTRIDAYIASLDQFRNWMVTSSPTSVAAL